MIRQYVILHGLLFAFACAHSEADRSLKSLIERQRDVLSWVPNPPPTAEELEKRRLAYVTRTAEARSRMYGDLGALRSDMLALGCTVEGDNPLLAVCPTLDQLTTDNRSSEAMYGVSLLIKFDDLRVRRFTFVRNTAKFEVEIEKRPMPLGPPEHRNVIPEAPTTEEIAQLEQEGAGWGLVRQAREYQERIDKHRETIRRLRENEKLRDEALDVLGSYMAVVDGELNLLHDVAFETVFWGNTMFAEDFEFTLNEAGTEVRAWCIPKPGGEQRIRQRAAGLKNASASIERDGDRLLMKFNHKPPPPTTPNLKK